MITSFTALRQRVLALLGALSMYRLVLFALLALAAIALGLSLAGLVGPSALEILTSFAVLAVVISAVDAAAQRVLRNRKRAERPFRRLMHA